jgi:hypothetical protein
MKRFLESSGNLMAIRNSMAQRSDEGHENAVRGTPGSSLETCSECYNYENQIARRQCS